MNFKYLLVVCLFSSFGCLGQDAEFILRATQKLSTNDGASIVDKLGTRFKDTYSEYARLMQSSQVGFSTVDIRQSKVLLGNGVEIEKNDYFFMIKTIYDYSASTNTKATVKFLTDSAGATIKYQTPYDRAAHYNPRIANGRTNSSISKMEYCQYYIWTERNGKRTASNNILYDILEDQELFINEDQLRGNK